MNDDTCFEFNWSFWHLWNWQFGQRVCNSPSFVARAAFTHLLNSSHLYVQGRNWPWLDLSIRSKFINTTMYAAIHTNWTPLIDTYCLFFCKPWGLPFSSWLLHTNDRHHLMAALTSPIWRVLHMHISWKVVWPLFVQLVFQESDLGRLAVFRPSR